MNGYEHYQRAEELAKRVAAGQVYGSETAATATLAQVHATLALAAATADATAFQRSLYEANGLEIPEKEARKRRAADRNADAANDYL
jgi:hypothetical protein